MLPVSLHAGKQYNVSLQPHDGSWYDTVNVPVVMVVDVTVVLVVVVVIVVVVEYVTGVVVISDTSQHL